MADADISSPLGYAAVGSVQRLANISADGANTVTVEADAAKRLHLGMKIDIRTTSTGDVVAENRYIMALTNQGTDEVQTLTIDATSGTFTLGFAGETTAPIAEDALSADVQTALLALEAFEPGDVVVAGDGPHTITFGGKYENTNVALITIESDDTAGGDGVSIVETTPGAGTLLVTYSGADAASNAATDDVYAAGDFTAQRSNFNGGTDDRSSFDMHQHTVRELRQRLKAINIAYYTDARLNTMTKNDMEYAVRVNDFGSSIKAS